MAAPVADFSVSDRVGTVPFSVTFTDYSTGSIDRRTWLLGDGATIQGNYTTVTYTYSVAGIYDVELYVEGPDGDNTLKKENYIVVEDEVHIPDMIIAQSESSTLDKYWKFYVDAEGHLVFETETMTYRSKDKIIDLNRWTFVEFHPLYKKMYVGSTITSRKEIQIITSVTSLPESPTSNKLLVAPNSSFTIDELRIFDKELNFKPYFDITRGKAATLR